MAPLSILPGRVRFEDPRLVGNETLSRHLESNVTVLDGVDMVSASHRTGRILVEFSEAQLTRDDLVACLREVLSRELPLTDACAKRAEAPTRPKRYPGFSSRSIIADMAFHLLLPAPFDLLLPALGSAFEREQPQSCTP